MAETDASDLRGWGTCERCGFVGNLYKFRWQLEWRGVQLYNFWKDAAHPRGLWRRTTLSCFRTPQPEWDVVLDIDRLAQTEQEDWIWGGASTLPGSHDRAILRLSRGGSDAVVLREFDIVTATCVSCAINALTAALAFALPGDEPPEAAEPAPSTMDDAETGGSGRVYAAIAVSGFCALAAESIWTRKIGRAHV